MLTSNCLLVLMVTFALVRTQESASDQSTAESHRRAKVFDASSKANYVAQSQSRDGGASYSAPSAGYSAPSYTPPSSYPAPGAQYSVPSYDNYVYEDDEDDKKKKLAIALPIAILAPFAVIGLLAILYFLLSLKALFSLSVLRVICSTNTNLASTNLCQLINSITIITPGTGRDETSKAFDKFFTSEKIGQLLSFLNSRFNLLDHLEHASQDQ